MFNAVRPSVYFCAAICSTDWSTSFKAVFFIQLFCDNLTRRLRCKLGCFGFNLVNHCRFRGFNLCRCLGLAAGNILFCFCRCGFPDALCRRGCVSKNILCLFLSFFFQPFKAVKLGLCFLAKGFLTSRLSSVQILSARASSISRKAAPAFSRPE